MHIANECESCDELTLATSHYRIDGGAAAAVVDVVNMCDQVKWYWNIQTNKNSFQFEHIPNAMWPKPTFTHHVNCKCTEWWHY